MNSIDSIKTDSIKTKETIKEEFLKWDEAVDIKTLKELTQDNLLSVEESKALSESIMNIEWKAKEDLKKLANEINGTDNSEISDEELKTIFEEQAKKWDYNIIQEGEQ